MDPRSMVTTRSDPEIWPFQNPGAHREVRRSEVAACRDGSAEESTVTGQSSGKRNTRRRENGTPVAVSEEESSKLVSTSSDIDLTECDAKRHKLVKCKDENGDSKLDMEGNYGNCYKPTDQSAQPSEVPKQDYIHVRARRGQATDSHSLAERARREKISERMKILQDLVPGCNKVIGKSLVLDEIINYIQSLQRQVEFLSMKLEVVNSRINSSMEEFPAKNFNLVHTFDNTDMTFASPAGREYTGEGSPQEWPPHMQVGTGFENVT